MTFGALDGHISVIEAQVRAIRERVDVLTAAAAEENEIDSFDVTSDGSIELEDGTAAEVGDLLGTLYALAGTAWNALGLDAGDEDDCDCE